MISESELVGSIGPLDAEALRRWIRPIETALEARPKKSPEFQKPSGRSFLKEIPESFGRRISPDPMSGYQGNQTLLACCRLSSAAGPEV